MNNKQQAQPQMGQQTSNTSVSLKQPFDTPSLFIKRPIPMKSPISKDLNIAHSSRNSSEGVHSSGEKLSRNLNQQLHDSPPQMSGISQRSLSFQLTNQGSQNMITHKENKPPQQNNTKNIGGAFLSEQQKVFGSPQSRRETPSKSYTNAFANLNIGNTAGSSSKYTSNFQNTTNISTSDFLKTIHQSPMLYKNLPNDWKYSPHITPQKSRGFEPLIHSNSMKVDNEIPSCILTRPYQQSLLSPAPDSNGVNQLDPYRQNQSKDKELTSRRLFQSPPKFKGSLVGSTRGGTKIFRNKLDNITEEDNIIPQNDNLSFYDNTFNPQGSQNNETDHGLIENTFQSKRPEIMIEDEDPNFTTPTVDQNYHNQYHHNNYHYPNETNYPLHSYGQAPPNQYHYKQAQYQQSHYNHHNSATTGNYQQDYMYMSSQKEIENCDRYHQNCKHSSRTHRSNVIQQLDLSKSNFINAHINIQFPNMPPSEIAGQGGYYHPHGDHMNDHKLRHYHYQSAMSEQGYYPIQINTKQKNYSSIKKKTGQRKQDLLGNNSGLKRPYGQFMKHSGKKQLIQSQTYQIPHPSQSQSQVLNPHSMSKSAQKQNYKRQAQLIQSQKVYENTPDTSAAQDALLQTPKGFNIQNTPDKVNDPTTGSNFKTPQILQSDNKSTQPLKTTCNCKKSKCLKLYCDCFAYGLGCSPDCNCADCANTEGNEERKQAMDQITERNPNAFKPKIQEKGFHSKGCHCKKSGCLKKYCECYQSGVVCTNLCACEGCKNCDENMASSRKHNDLEETNDNIGLDDDKMSLVMNSTHKGYSEFKQNEISKDIIMQSPCIDTPKVKIESTHDQNSSSKKSPSIQKDILTPQSPKSHQVQIVTKQSSKKVKQVQIVNQIEEVKQFIQTPIKEIQFKPESVTLQTTTQKPSALENRPLKRQKITHNNESPQLITQNDNQKLQSQSSSHQNSIIPQPEPRQTRKKAAALESKDTQNQQTSQKQLDAPQVQSIIKDEEKKEQQPADNQPSQVTTRSRRRQVETIPPSTQTQSGTTGQSASNTHITRSQRKQQQH